MRCTASSCKSKTSGGGSSSSSGRPWSSCRPSCPAHRWPVRSSSRLRPGRTTRDRDAELRIHALARASAARFTSERKRNGNRSSSSLDCRDYGAGPARDKPADRGNARMVDDLRRLGMTPRGPDSKAGPSSARSDSCRVDPGPSVAPPAGTGATGRARGAGSATHGVDRRRGRNHGPGADPPAETG